jgi:hypothetical protein
MAVVADGQVAQGGRTTESPAQGLCCDRCAQQGGRVPARKTDKVPHFAIMFCVNALRMTLLPMEC